LSHGKADKVTDPALSQALSDESKDKTIRLNDDVRLLFEPVPLDWRRRTLVFLDLRFDPLLEIEELRPASRSACSALASSKAVSAVF